MHASLPSEARTGGAETTDGPLVSIGLPVYNGEPFLRPAIESLLAQSHANLELIISDNASTDDTAAICGEYAAGDKRVRYFRQPHNVGAPRNWNFVANRARGQYMKWATANDYCDRTMLAACLVVLESDPRVVLCYGRTHLVDEATGVARPYDGDLSLTEEQPSVRLARLNRELKLNNAMNGLIRMDALRKSGMIRLYPAGDLILMAELAMVGMFVLLPEPLLFRRVGPRTFSGYLSKAEQRHFFDPGAKSEPRLVWLRRYIDYSASVLRASMSISEKQRALTLVARYAYWHLWPRNGHP